MPPLPPVEKEAPKPAPKRASEPSGETNSEAPAKPRNSPAEARRQPQGPKPPATKRTSRRDTQSAAPKAPKKPSQKRSQRPSQIPKGSEKGAQKTVPPRSERPSSRALASRGEANYNTTKEGDIDLGDGWFIDSKTKKKYRAIPKLEIDKSSGHSAGVITDDIDTLDFNNSAKQFLAHLQVPPDEREMERIKAARAKRAERIREEYDKTWSGSQGNDTEGE